MKNPSRPTFLSAAAAALIFPKLKSSDAKVRRTAQKAWDSLKEPSS